MELIKRDIDFNRNVPGEVTMAQKLFIDLAAHPQTILDAMDGMRPAIEKAVRRQKWILPINILRGLLILAGLILVYEPGKLQIGILLIVITILSFFIYRPKRVYGKARFDAAYQVIHTLRDDAGRKGRLVGRLDLSPPDQKTKLLRTGRTSHGNMKYYYRDPWFLARLKLADGSVVKLLLEDRVKVKKGGVVYHLTNWQNKVLINPGIYEYAGEYDPSKPSILTGAGQLDPKLPAVALMLDDLKAIYTQARPLEAASGSLPPGSEVAPTESQPPENPLGHEAGISSTGGQAT
jgi:hypothetical protein